MVALANTMVSSTTEITERISSCIRYCKLSPLISPNSLNDDLDLETEAGDTQFSADVNSREALMTLVEGDLWMIYRNVITDVLHWDFVRVSYRTQTQN